MLALSLSDKFCCFGVFVFNFFVFNRFLFFRFSFRHFFVLVLVFVNEFVIFSFYTVFVNENHTDSQFRRPAGMYWELNPIGSGGIRVNPV